MVHVRVRCHATDGSKLVDASTEVFAGRANGSRAVRSREWILPQLRWSLKGRLPTQNGPLVVAGGHVRIAYGRFRENWLVRSKNRPRLDGIGIFLVQRLTALVERVRDAGASSTTAVGGRVWRTLSGVKVSGCFFRGKRKGSKSLSTYGLPVGHSFFSWKRASIHCSWYFN